MTANYRKGCIFPLEKSPKERSRDVEGWIKESRKWTGRRRAAFTASSVEPAVTSVVHATDGRWHSCATSISECLLLVISIWGR